MSSWRLSISGTLGTLYYRHIYSYHYLVPDLHTRQVPPDYILIPVNDLMRDYKKKKKRTAATVLVVLYDDTSRCTYSSLKPLVPGTAYLVPGTVHASTQQTIQIRGTGVCLARKNSL